jgi:hypothetical protein
MLWDTTIAATAGYMAALLYNQNNVASMASGVTLQLEREVIQYFLLSRLMFRNEATVCRTVVNKLQGYYLLKIQPCYWDSFT